MAPPMVQIYTMQTVAEARAMARIGVHRIGMAPADRGLPGEISIDLGRRIADSVRDRATVSALTVEADLDRIVAMVDAVRPHVLHLSGDTSAVPPEAVTELRDRLPGVEIMQAIAMTGPEAIDVAASYEDVADCLILDSVSREVEGIGAAGVVHDWDVSRQIVASVRIPVILAGGLGPENVAAAVAAVRPWGVDSLTHTNRPLAGGGFRKDPDKVIAFLRAVGWPGR